MARRQPARKRRRAPRSSILLRWVAVALALFVGFLYYQPLTSYLERRAALSQRAAEVEALKAKQRELRRRLEAGDSEQALAREARRLGLVKPGERLFIVKGVEAWRRARRATIGEGG